MTKIRRQLARAATATGAALALLTGGAIAAPPSAQAATLGRVCMLNAPDGAYGAGHAAFIIKVRGQANHWIYGSFGSATDRPASGWIRGGTWQQARAKFRAVRDEDGAQYYRRYRCTNTADGDARTAQSWYNAVRNRGYNVHTNNCLHMSMAVAKGYSAVLRHSTRLPSATNWAPNNYYNKVLPKAYWEASHSLL